MGSSSFPSTRDLLAAQAAETSPKIAEARGLDTAAGACGAMTQKVI
jgi:hypothetical protein